MERNQKERMITIMIGVCVVVAILSVIGVMVTKKKPVETTEEEQQEEIEEVLIQEEDTRPSAGIENFEFSIESVLYENGSTIFEVKITNKSSETNYLNEFIMKVKDSEGEEIAGVYGVVGEEIEGEGSVRRSCYYGGDISNYGSIEYEIER